MQTYQGFNQATQQEQLYNQQEESYYARPPVTTDAAVARWELENDDIIEELGHSLRGEIYNYAKRTYERPTNVEPIMNETGVNSILAIINNYLNKNTTLSWLEEEAIMKTMEGLMWAIQRDLIINQKAYGVKMHSKYYLLLKLIEHDVYSSLMRAYKGKTMEYRRKVISAHENIIQREQTVQRQNKMGGFLNNLFGRKNRNQGTPQQNTYGGAE